jgi:hypothetical protein
MPRIERKAIHPHVAAVAELLQVLLPGIVAVVAEALELPQPELIDVTAPWLDVIGDTSGDRTTTFPQAHRAQRLNPELMTGQPSPALGSVEAHRI